MTEFLAFWGLVYLAVAGGALLLRLIVGGAR